MEETLLATQNKFKQIQQQFAFADKEDERWAQKAEALVDAGYTVELTHDYDEFAEMAKTNIHFANFLKNGFGIDETHPDFSAEERDKAFAYLSIMADNRIKASQKINCSGSH